MPEVSVIIPSYNHAAYIGEAVTSVLSQTLEDLELIVVDDGSSDDSLEVLSRFSDVRMRLITQSNQGAHAAINRGLRESAGNYLSILNSDDSYHPQRLQKTIAALTENPAAGLASSYIQIMDADSRDLSVKQGYLDSSPWPLDEPGRSFRTGHNLRAALLTENYLATTSNYVFPRQVFELVGEFRPLRYAHDWDYALRIAHDREIILIPEPLLKYRVHERNTIRENQAAMIFEICWILAVHLPSNISTAWFSERPPEERLDQLLHSLRFYKPFLRNLDPFLWLCLLHYI